MKPTVRSALEQCGLVPGDARALLSHALGRDRAWLVAHAGDALEDVHADAFLALAKRRREGEPVAYLVGQREFWGLPLEVSPSVLIPRPETETLVEAALARLPVGEPSRIVDLGTGCGAIALAIAKERPQAQVTATDVSEAALAVARCNARRLGVHNVTFIGADWYAGLAGEPFDAIVSNPPYVDPGDPHLSQGDVRFEPRIALTPGGDALRALRTIVGGAREHLLRGGTLVVEHGYDQGALVRQLFESAGFDEVTSLRDIAGIDRVVSGRAP